ncbi:HTH-type transcriptional regulator GltC (plasmid) [Variovorax sp. SRS16]|uniref:LysR family transcriptional regulator n=1 Tax=Variovorax sp. SRS16 TaxID=282217 RepID=UPI001319A940|nr:LysR family transcriptional regulator [Variovorax sp. SRS16]VTU46342.1 HTH-type transcriptional regulator GltC [Variovorax sp. SRS16]
MSVTIRQLRAFAGVAEAGSFTAAAAQLNLTQSALSVLVRELEAEVGVRLFDRHTRGVLLSEAGREFQPRVRGLLSDLNEALSSVAELGARKKGFVRLAAPQLIASAVLPEVIAVYRKKFPGIEVRLTDTLPENLLEELASGRAELVFGHELPHGESVEGTVFLEDPFWLICRSDDPLARRRRVAWTDIASRTFIGPTRDFRQRLLPELEVRTRERIAAAGTQDVSYLTTALGLVMAGQGITVGPSYAARLVRAYGLRMIELGSPVFKRRVSVYRVVRRGPSPAAAAFIETLNEVIRTQARKARA